MVGNAAPLIGPERPQLLDRLEAAILSPPTVARDHYHSGPLSQVVSRGFRPYLRPSPHVPITVLGERVGEVVLQLTALAVSAVALVCEQRALRPTDFVEVTWRHYRDDPPAVWFMEVEVVTGQMRHRATLLHTGQPVSR